MKYLSAAVVTFVLVSPQLGHAQTLADLEAAESRMYEVWESLPLTIRNARLAATGPDKLGVYEERESNRYKVGEPIYIHAEPVGYEWKETSPGTYNIDFSLAATVVDADGKEVGVISSDPPPVYSGFRLTSFTLKYELKLTEVSAGDYTAILELVDDNSAESVTFDVPITIID